MNPGSPSVLFVCVKNAGKSQMAAGLMRKIAGDAVRVYSAGTKPGDAINTLSAQALSEVGVDISTEAPKPIEPQLLRDVDVVVTLGREAHVEPVREPGSRTGIPMSLLNAASRGSNGCDWSATTSPRASPTCISPTTSGFGMTPPKVDFALGVAPAHMSADRCERLPKPWTGNLVASFLRPIE